MNDPARPLISVPLISVIVPVHDVAGHVAAAIASLRAQTLTDFEAIIVDDGSTDGSGDLAAAAAAGDPRFRLIRQANRGLSGARNAGLDAARGACIAFLDGDDRLAPEYLERLHDRLVATGADWVACAIRNMHPDGSSDAHSAIHGAPEPGAPGRYPFTDWRAVIRHFPSAWNKLYRRDLVEGLRFDEGTWFEDHAFYYRAAARTDHLEHLPEPLYLQTRGRPGQITAADSERVFEQLSVLEALEGLLDGAKTGGAEAFARLASRLVFERSTALHDRDRRARFAAAARAFFAERALPWRPDWDGGIGRAWGLTMAGVVPVSVIIPSDGAPGPLAATLESLAAQTLRDTEILVVTDPGTALPAPPAAPALRHLVQPGRGPGPARDHGLSQAHGEYVVFLDAGDRLAPHALEHRVDTLLRSGAECGVAPMHIGTAVHDGWHDPPARVPGGLIPAAPDFAIRLHAHPSAWIFRRELPAGPGFGAGALGGWRRMIAAVLAARWVQWFETPDCMIGEEPEARRLWHAPARARDLARGIDAIAALPGAARLPAGWQRRLFARAVWEKTRFAAYRTPDGAARFLARALVMARWRRWIGAGPLDPYLDPALRRLFGAPPG